VRSEHPQGRSTPNPRLQRTPSAPLSRKPLGRRKLRVGSTIAVLLLLAVGRAPASEELVYVTLKAPRELKGAHVFVEGNDWGPLTFRQETGPDVVSMQLDLPNVGVTKVLVVKPGYKSLHLVVQPRAGRVRYSIRIRPDQVIHEQTKAPAA
jgi:hypothetical protein